MIETCSFTVTASASNTWTAVENATWLTLICGTGTGNGTFSVRTSKNLVPGSRSTYVCVVSCSAQQNVLVTQYGCVMD